MSSGAKVTRPSRSASSACSSSPACFSAAASPSGSPRNLVAILVSPLPIGSGPRFISPTAITAGSASGPASVNSPASMYERSAASGSSSSDPAQQQPVMGQHQPRVAAAAQQPGAKLRLVGAQVQDQVVQLAGHRERPEAGPLLA